MDERTDHQLMTAVRDGDLDKLGYLFEKYHKRLYNFFLRQVRDSQSCEDMVQEVFLRMMKYRRTYQGKGKFTTWMYSIAHNTMIDHFKKAGNRYEFTNELDRLVSVQPTPEELSERSNRYEFLYKALGRLSDEKREVLVLSRFHDLKYEEISKVLGCPVGTIKARVYHAMNELRAIFNEQRDEATP